MKKENLFTPDCIRTVSGIYMNVFQPTIDMICIEDIAHALSMQCRFGGHLPVFYSVAQHSVMVSLLVSEESALAALLHDASEAYLLDVPRPIKQKLTNYKAIEETLMHLIAEKFGFEYPLSEDVKSKDELMLEREWCEIMIGNDSHRACWDAPTAKRAFLNKFEMLNKLPLTYNKP